MASVPQRLARVRIVAIFGSFAVPHEASDVPRDDGEEMSVESERAQSAGSNDGEEARGDVDDGNGERDVSYRGCEKPRGLIFDEGDDVVDSRGFRGGGESGESRGVGRGRGSGVAPQPEATRRALDAIGVAREAQGGERAEGVVAGEDADGEDAGPRAHAAEGEATDGEERERASLGARTDRANRAMGPASPLVARRGLDRGLDRGRDRACTLLGSALGRELVASAATKGAPPSLPRRTHGARRRDDLT